MFLFGKRSLSLLPLLLISFFAVSQEISPYSRYGLGQMDNTVSTAQRGLGGFAAAYRNPLYVNFINPASYTSIAFATLEGGIKATTKSILDGQSEKSYRAGDAFIDYFVIGLPIKRAGVSFGLVPYSSMNYNFTQSKVYDVGSAKKLFEGNGRIYQFYLGGAYRFQKIDTMKNSLSIGMNLVYLFGTLNRRSLLQFSPQDYYNARVNTSAHMSNVALNFGLQYRRNLNKKVYAMLGAYSYFPVAVGSSSEDTWSRYVRLTTGTYIVDTVFQNNGDLAGMKIPVETGAGISFGKQYRWQAGVDFKYKVWSDVESFSPDITLENSWEVRGGAELSPKPSRNFFNKLTYRFGGFYDSGYLNVDGTKIPEYGGSFGFSIPIIQNLGKDVTTNSRLNFSFEAGNRGTISNGLVKETFFRAYIGFTLNDTQWFKKRLLD